jgi:hypothetical protein
MSLNFLFRTAIDSRAFLVPPIGVGAITDQTATSFRESSEGFAATTIGRDATASDRDRKGFWTTRFQNPELCSRLPRRPDRPRSLRLASVGTSVTRSAPSDTDNPSQK